MTQLKGFKFVKTLVLVFRKTESKDKTKYVQKHSSSEAEIIVSEKVIDDMSIYTTIKIDKSLGKGSGWIIIDSVTDHTISISNHNPLAGSSCIKLPKESDHPRKGRIDIQNTDDNDFFKWCLVRYFNPADHNRRITKADKHFAKRLGFKDKISSQN